LKLGRIIRRIVDEPEAVNVDKNNRNALRASSPHFARRFGNPMKGSW